MYSVKVFYKIYSLIKMGASCCKNKVNPFTPSDLEIINVLYNYSTFVGTFLKFTKKHLSKEFCANHHEFHDKYNILRKKLNDPTKYDIRFQYIYTNFIDTLSELYKMNKLTIDPDLLKTKQIREIFHIDNNL
jgi:hypothetical protein